MGANHNGYSRTIFFFSLFNCLWFWGLKLFILNLKRQIRKSVTLWRIYVFKKRRAFQGYLSKLQLINTKKHTKKWYSESCEMRRDYIIDLAWKLHYGVHTNIFFPNPLFCCFANWLPGLRKTKSWLITWLNYVPWFDSLLATTMRVRARFVSCRNITYGDRRVPHPRGSFCVMDYWWKANARTGDLRT